MAFTLPRAPQTDDELHLLIKAMWGIDLPRKSVCPGHASPFDAVSHAFFGKEPGYAVWYASRGSGKSLALAVLGLTKSLVLDVDCTILGGSMTQSKNVAEHMAKLLAYKNAPSYAIEKHIQSEIRLHTQKTIRPLPASQTTVRGPHPPLQLLDEVDEMDEDIYNASLGQAMEQINHLGQVVNEYIVASSTWQNPIGTFTNVIDNARREGLPIFTWCWRELLQPHGWMSQRFIDQKRQAVSEEMWRCLPTDEPVQTRRGEVAIQDIKDGDEVWTRQGWRHVTALVRQHDRHVYTVTTDDGRLYRATANHKAATPQGWAETSSLRVGDTLVTADPPHTLPLARSAGAVTPVVDAGLKIPVVAVDADLSSVMEVALAGVVGAADSLKVAGLNTPSDVAGVVHGHALWQRPVPRQVGDPVGVVDSAYLADPVPVLGGGASPYPALPAGSGSLHHVGLQVVDTGTCHVVSVSVSDLPEATWDISVEGTHEFTVSGIVVHNTEYELNEPSGASRAIDLEAVEQYFTDYPKPLREEHAPGDRDDFWVWEEPDRYGLYAAGADWAKEKDKTVLAVVRYDCHPRRMVALRRMSKMRYPVMTGAFDTLVKDYRAVAQHDKTGVGNAVNDFLSDDAAKGFIMVGRKRSQMFVDYIADFEHGGYSLPRNVEMFYRAHRGATTADVYAPHKWDSHTPDDLVAMAMAHRAAGRVPAGLLHDGLVPKDGTPRPEDRQFHVRPYADDNYRTEGGVTVVDERYDDVAVFNLSL